MAVGERWPLQEVTIIYKEGCNILYTVSKYAKEKMELIYNVLVEKK